MLGVQQNQGGGQHDGKPQSASREPGPHQGQDGRSRHYRKRCYADHCGGCGDGRADRHEKGQLAHGPQAQDAARKPTSHRPDRIGFQHIDAGVEQGLADGVSDQQINDQVEDDRYAGQGDAAGRIERHQADGQQPVGGPEGRNAQVRAGQELAKREAGDDGHGQAQQQSVLPSLLVLCQLLPHAYPGSPRTITPTACRGCRLICGCVALPQWYAVATFNSGLTSFLAERPLCERTTMHRARRVSSAWRPRRLRAGFSRRGYPSVGRVRGDG